MVCGCYSRTARLPSRPPGNTGKSMVTGGMASDRLQGVSVNKTLSYSDDFRQTPLHPYQVGTGLGSLGRLFTEHVVFGFNHS